MKRLSDYVQDVALLAQACVWALLDGVSESDGGGSGGGDPAGGVRRRRWFNVVAVRDGTMPTAWRPDTSLAPADLQTVQVFQGTVSVAKGV